MRSIVAAAVSILSCVSRIFSSQPLSPHQRGGGRPSRRDRHQGKGGLAADRPPLSPTEPPCHFAFARYAFPDPGS
jgi:hypothetical protein